MVKAKRKQRIAGMNCNHPSDAASEHPNKTGVAAAANVLGRAAKTQAYIEFVFTFSMCRLFLAKLMKTKSRSKFICFCS